jgi:phospholipid/cholesterol/gamma-HCH transport system permease protein
MTPSALARPRLDFSQRLRRPLGWLGRAVQLRLRFVLMLMALAFGILAEAARPRTWRRSVWAEFRRVLRMALGGSLPATVFVAALVGLGMVYQALYWLRVAGQEGSAGTILVTILLREVAPLLVGVILLGRSGSVMLIELGRLRSDRQIRALQAQGIDPFRLLVMPRGIAFALASYTLSVAFILVTLSTGFTVAGLMGIVQTSIWSFLDGVLRATAPGDFVVFPLKTLTIGLLVGATASLTALSAEPEDDHGRLLARGFIRGMLAIMLTSGLLSLAV